jgi:hypothetical protein
MKLIKKIFLSLLGIPLFLVVLGLFTFKHPVSAQSASMTSVRHVFVIFMENKDWSSITPSAAPYMNNTLMKIGAHANNYHNIPTSMGSLHPSEPNYIFFEGGTNSYSDYTFTTDNNSSASNSTNSSAHLATLLTNAGHSWKAYQENIPSGCPINSSGQYAAKHNPFVFFKDISGNPPSIGNANCTAHMEDLTTTSLQNDLASGNVADYNFLTPNLCNDMHDCSVTTGDTWLSTFIPIIMNSNLYKQDGAIFITWDEDAGSDNKPIGMIILSPFAKVNYSNSIEYSHASLTKSIERIFNLSPLVGHAADSTTQDLSDFFGTSNQTSPTPTPTPTPTGVNQTPTPTQSPTPTPTPTQCPVLPTNTGIAQSLINISTSGTYYVWSRMQSMGDSANSYWLQIDNNCGVDVGDLNGMPTGIWTWVNYQDGNTASKTSLSLTQGNHTIKLIGRENNTKLDKVLLTNDPSCVPTGFGDNCPAVAVNPTPTGVSGNATALSLTIGLDGIGSTGDNVTTVSTDSNKNPNTTTRPLTVKLFNTSNTETDYTGTMTYNSTSGLFTSTVNLGTNFASGNYLVKVVTDGHLVRLIPGTQTINAGTTNTMPRVNLFAGDVNNDNALTILDYNILMSCMQDVSISNPDGGALCRQNTSYATRSDLDDNGIVNKFDYNLFLREYPVQKGD